MFAHGKLGAMRRMAWWIAVVAAGELLLLWLGSGALAGPHLTEPGSWLRWLMNRGTDVAVLALVRLGALWAGAYLLVVLVLGTVVRALRLRLLIRLGDLVTPPSLRTLLDRAMGVTAAGTLVVASLAGRTPPATAADAHERPPVGASGPPITLRGLAGPAPDRAPTTTTTIPLPPVATLPVEAAAPPLPATVPPALPPPLPPEGAPESAAESPPAMPPPTPAPAGDTWTVGRGDNFWAISSGLLADSWGRPPSVAETDPYWRALIEANRSRLVDAGNPDLLLPGQVLAVPPPPPARAA